MRVSNRPKRAAAAIPLRGAVLFLLVLSMFVAESSARAAANIANLPTEWITSANLYNICVWNYKEGRISDLGLATCCGFAKSTCDGECQYEHGDSDDLTLCENACHDGHNWCVFKEFVNPVEDQTPGFYVPPVVAEINGDPRVDYCLDGDTGCGARAAHAFCARYEGPGFVARSFGGDGAPAALDDITWQLGAWFPRQPYGTGQGFAFIECAPSSWTPPTYDVAKDSDDDGWADAEDNCPAMPNPLQENLDGDVAGDLCDPEPLVSHACSNGIDDDGDGLTDDADPGCFDRLDDSEQASGLECDDGLDNDGDGLIDMDDEQCATPDDNNELASPCENGIDDDGDGLVDLADPGCADSDDPSEFGDRWGNASSDLNEALAVADFDGDGRDDIVEIEYDAGTYRLLVATSLGTAFDSQRSWMSGWSPSAIDWLGQASYCRTPLFAQDADGDGRADLVFFDYALQKVTVLYSNGSTFLPPADTAQPYTCYAARRDTWMLDVTGDGRADVLELDDDTGIYVYQNRGTGFDQPTRWSAEFGRFTQDSQRWDAGLGIPSTPKRKLADVDGDGRPDFIGFGVDAAYVGLNTGSSFAPAEVWITEFSEINGGWIGDAEHPIHMADVDGDGRADIVGFAHFGVRVALSDGQQFAPSRTWIPEVHMGLGYDWDADEHPAFVADLDADGRADFIGLGPQGAIIAAATGGGFTDLVSLGSGLTSYDGWGESHPDDPYSKSDLRTLADVDGDGRAELVGVGLTGTYVGEIPIPLPEPSVALGLLTGMGVVGVLEGRRVRSRAATR